MRAIGHAIRNENGDSFIRHDQDSCSVELNFHDKGVKFKWVKRRGVGGYYILNDDVDNPYDKLNGEVPEFVSQLAGIDFMSIKNGEKKYYPQLCDDQHSTLFLVGESDPVKTELIAELAEVTYITKALKLLKKDTKSREIELSTRKKDLSKYQDTWDAVGNIDIDGDYKEIESLKDGILSDMRLRKSLEELEISHSDTVSEESVLSGIPEFDGSKELKNIQLDSLSSLVDIYQEKERVYDLLGVLVDIPDPVKDYGSECSVTTLGNLVLLDTEFQDLNKLSKLSIPDNPDIGVGDDLELLDTISGLLFEYNSLLTQEELFLETSELDIKSPEMPEVVELESLESIMRDYYVISEQHGTLLMSLESLNSELEEIRKEKDEFPECPMCNRPFSEEEKCLTS
jgi:hypothetical protein